MTSLHFRFVAWIITGRNSFMARRERISLVSVLGLKRLCGRSGPVWTRLIGTLSRITLGILRSVGFVLCRLILLAGTRVFRFPLRVC